MNISDVRDCYGCGVCATICPKKIIDMRLNQAGFYEPRIIDEEKCINCSLCVNCCSYLNDGLSLSPQSVKSYAAWSRDASVRRKCSSGGVGFEVARTLLGRGYKVCAVKYNAEQDRAEHYIASTIEELIPSIGSKYIQSYTVDGFNEVDKNEKYIVTGSPCQIDSFRRYIRKFKKEDNFVLLDFFCHGVPSMLLWQKYIKDVEQITGKIVYASWRNKFTGWHDSWAMAIDGDMKGESVDWHDSYNVLIRGKKSYYNSRLSQGDAFFQLFLSDACLGKACYDKCKFKYSHSSADIRIGDLWGTVYKDNEEGVSAAISFTDKGDELLKNCGCELIEHSFDVVAEGQMKKCPVRTKFYYKAQQLLQLDSCTAVDIYNEYRKYLRYSRIHNRIKHPVRTVKSVIKKLTRKA